MSTLCCFFSFSFSILFFSHTCYLKAKTGFCYFWIRKIYLLIIFLCPGNSLSTLNRNMKAKLNQHQNNTIIQVLLLSLCKCGGWGIGGGVTCLKSKASKLQNWHSSQEILLHALCLSLVTITLNYHKSLNRDKRKCAI